MIINNNLRYKYKYTSYKRVRSRSKCLERGFHRRESIDPAEFHKKEHMKEYGRKKSLRSRDNENFNNKTSNFSQPILEPVYKLPKKGKSHSKKGKYLSKSKSRSYSSKSDKSYKSDKSPENKNNKKILTEKSLSSKNNLSKYSKRNYRKGGITINT